MENYITSILYEVYTHLGFPGSSAGKESSCNVEDLGSIPGLGRSSGGGNGYPLQYSGLENSMDWIVHGVAKSQTWLRDFYFHYTHIHDKYVCLNSLMFSPVFYDDRANFWSVSFCSVFMMKGWVIVSCVVQGVAPVLEETVFNLCLKLMSKDNLFPLEKLKFCHILFSYTKLEFCFL